jgi:predicted transposase YbfD/YdcC
MKRLLNHAARVEKFFRRLCKNRAFQFWEAPDPRQKGKVKHSIDSVIRGLLGGLLGNQPTLRQLEEHCGSGSLLDSRKRISDTTLHGMASRLDEGYLVKKLVAQVKHFNRKKMIRGADLPFSAIAIDGKNQGTLSHDAGGRAQSRSSKSAEKWDAQCDRGGGQYVTPVLRATLISSEQRLAMYQMPVPPETGEAAVFTDFITQIDEAYGRTGLIDVVTADAGMCSLENADAVEAQNLTYVFGLKGNQKSLHEAAQVLLLGKAAEQAPEAQTSWEKAHGTEIRRQLWRTPELQGFGNTVGTWEHLRQGWLVRQTTRNKMGQKCVEDRYFVTNMLPGRATPKQMLALIRAHWRIENDTFNSLDVQWKEDSTPWCAKGSALWALGLLRLMAYNIMQHLRRCHLRRRTGTLAETALLAWRDVFGAVITMMTLIAARENATG